MRLMEMNHIKKSFDGNTNSQIVLMVKNLNLMEVNNELQ